MVLKQGSRGADVRQLQTRLAALGFALSVDGVYGGSTAAAVRSFQLRQALVPDGVAGTKTIRAMALSTAASVTAKHAHCAASMRVDQVRDLMNVIGSFILPIAVTSTRAPLRADPVRCASNCSISAQGLQFIYSHEAQAGVSNRLHWPRGASGVTLGPGYDMKERSQATIVSDMLSLGLDSKIANAVSLAAGLVNEDAREFTATHRLIVNLNQAQELRLLSIIIGQYERLVRNFVTIEIYQHQYDSLVSFAYNPGGRLKRVAHFLNAGLIASAMQEIQRAVTSGGTVLRGLTLRRQHEVALYLYGRYTR